ncbi:MAG: ferredoxin family protein [Candidatus Bathyarchaeia archaeon]
MPGGSYFSIPREKIKWFPTIDYDKCIGCLACVNFCRNGVYEVSENPSKPKVANPYNCVVGCSACASLCPNEAIKFPPRGELIAALKELYRQAK